MSHIKPEQAASGRVVEICRLAPCHGMGLSLSSSHLVLIVAALLRFLPDDPALAAVIALATQIEAALAHGFKVGIQDVVSIAVGGAVETHTTASGGISFRRVAAPDPHWITRHAFIAFDPGGRRHAVPELLPLLLRHPDIRLHFERICQLALQASEAYRRGDVFSLGSAVSEYVRLFEAISGGVFVNPAVRHLAGRLEKALGHRLVAWKPPGAGDASSIAALVVDEAARDKALQVCRAAGWAAAPVIPTGGLLHEAYGSGCVYTAGLRIDWVGLADLGSNCIAEGVCFGTAIEPRNELVISSVPARE